MRCQRLAQPRRPHGRRLAQKRTLGVAGQHITHGARPHGVREQLRSRRASRQIGCERLFADQPRSFLDGIGAQGRTPARRRGRRQRDGVRIVAPARLRSHVAFRRQLLVGALHRDQAHTQMIRQRALRGQFGVRRDSARFDISLDAAIEVPVEALPVPIVERIREHGSPRLSSCFTSGPKSDYTITSNFDHTSIAT